MLHTETQAHERAHTHTRKFTDVLTKIDIELIFIAPMCGVKVENLILISI